MPPDRAARDMSGAVDLLADHEAVTSDGIGVVGFCMGGLLTFVLAALRPDKIKAAVPFYGYPAGRPATRLLGDHGPDPGPHGRARRLLRPRGRAGARAAAAASSARTSRSPCTPAPATPSWRPTTRSARTTRRPTTGSGRRCSASCTSTSTEASRTNRRRRATRRRRHPHRPGARRPAVRERRAAPSGAPAGCRVDAGSPSTASASNATTPVRWHACRAGRRCSPASIPTCTASPRPTGSARTPTTRPCGGSVPARCRRSATGSASPATTRATRASGTCPMPICTTTRPGVRWPPMTTTASSMHAAVARYRSCRPARSVRVLRLDRARTARRRARQQRAAARPAHGRSRGRHGSTDRYARRRARRRRRRCDRSCSSPASSIRTTSCCSRCGRATTRSATPTTMCLACRRHRPPTRTSRPSPLPRPRSAPRTRPATHRCRPTSTTARADEYRRLYYRLHAEVDGAIDAVRSAVTEGGSDDAVIVLTADHGELLGAHGGLHQKWFNLYDEATRVPFVIARAGRSPTSRAPDRRARDVTCRPRADAAVGGRHRRRSRRRSSWRHVQRAPSVARSRPDAGGRRHPAARPPIVPSIS